MLARTGKTAGRCVNASTVTIARAGTIFRAMGSLVTIRIGTPSLAIINHVIVSRVIVSRVTHSRVIACRSETVDVNVSSHAGHDGVSAISRVAVRPNKMHVTSIILQMLPRADQRLGPRQK
jgi:hypothetical protein